VEPSQQWQVRVSEQCAGGRSELIVASFLLAQIKPFAAILGGGLALNLNDLVITADGATNDSIGPAHLFDVVKALIVSREPYEDFTRG